MVAGLLVFLPPYPCRDLERSIIENELNTTTLRCRRHRSRMRIVPSRFAADNSDNSIKQIVPGRRAQSARLQRCFRELEPLARLVQHPLAEVGLAQVRARARATVRVGVGGRGWEWGLG